MSGLTWKELRDLDLAGIEDAADGWGEVSDRADAARRRVDNEMTAKLSETQKGEAEKAAVKRLKRLSENFQYIYTECGMARTALNGLAAELKPAQKKLKEALADAAELKFTVHEDGSVSYPAAEDVDGKPAGGTLSGSRGFFDGVLPDMAAMADRNPNRQKAQDIADRVSGALREAQGVDDTYKPTIERLRTTPGLTVTDAMWTDAAGDAGALRKAADDYLQDRLPLIETPEKRKEWWDGLSDEERSMYLTTYPDEIGNLDGIPAEVRDQANRTNLPLLMGKLEGEGTEEARTKLQGLRIIDSKLREGSEPPMFLLGVGDEGNGRAIVSYGNPDTSRNVSAYVPGLGTGLDKDFANNDLERARDTAIGAQNIDPSSASIVWLGYDAPQFPAKDLAGNLAVGSEDNALKGVPAYKNFMAGLQATNENADPHLTAIGHSYGSLTVGKAAQDGDGIPGVDDIILVGSPGTGADKASDLNVGADHVHVGSAENDPVTKLPSKREVATGAPFSPLTHVPGVNRVLDEISDPGGDDIWFGKDPASAAFGARRFKVDDGPAPFSPGGDDHGMIPGFSWDDDITPDTDWTNFMPAHSNYFNPDADHTSAQNIAAIVANQSDEIVPEQPR